MPIKSGVPTSRGAVGEATLSWPSAAGGAVGAAQHSEHSTHSTAPPLQHRTAHHPPLNRKPARFRLRDGRHGSLASLVALTGIALRRHSARPHWNVEPTATSRPIVSAQVPASSPPLEAHVFELTLSPSSLRAAPPSHVCFPGIHRRSASTPLPAPVRPLRASRRR